MLAIALCLAAIGLLCGLGLLHWFFLGFISLALSGAIIAASPWDLMLVPKWFGALAVLQVNYLVAAACRLWWSDRLSIRNKAEPDDKTEPEAEQILAGERVLIVEDDPVIAALLAG